MKPAWDKLGDEYADSSSVLIGDVDCTNVANIEMCGKLEIESYPTIKYWMDGNVKDYKSGRDYATMKEFVEVVLQKPCDVVTLENCNDKETGYVKKMKSKSAAEREAQLVRLFGMKDNDMKGELKTWLVQRTFLLTAMKEKKDEL
eukprot:CAMPEP_0171295472 /NCGR_PEP_ID=MMETSP0816-20121228/4041_1 /TAXON_ID=420281 /ORGANISM="Proboscia inermis, Strain CCAP1064/1" /LENGTH=144 /DNA_ID=CAMNT_0011768125 /DNA_START=85 /DNA_END=519 /DNA_ORIENTATION=+